MCEGEGPHPAEFRAEERAPVPSQDAAARVDGGLVGASSRIRCCVGSDAGKRLKQISPPVLIGHQVLQLLAELGQLEGGFGATLALERMRRLVQELPIALYMRTCNHQYRRCGGRERDRSGAKCQRKDTGKGAGRRAVTRAGPRVGKVRFSSYLSYETNFPVHGLPA